MAKAGTNLYNSPIMGLPFRTIGAAGMVGKHYIGKALNKSVAKMDKSTLDPHYGNYQLYTKSGD